MRYLAGLLAYCCIAVVSFYSESAIAAEKVGKAVAVIDQASTTGTAGESTLAVGMEVSLGERITTDSEGQAQLLFNDGTKMVVGPNSDLILDEFVFRSSAAENKFIVRAFNGAFRFITGGNQKDAYLIHTPSATIGVRGTTFDFAVTRGETNLLLLHGGATVCGNNGECTLTDVDN